MERVLFLAQWWHWDQHNILFSARLEERFSIKETYNNALLILLVPIIIQLSEQKVSKL